jgi:hypothetical protein
MSQKRLDPKTGREQIWMGLTELFFVPIYGRLGGYCSFKM